MTQEQFNGMYRAMLAEQHGGEHDKWAEDAFEWAKDAGLLLGDGAGNYEMKEPITRQEMTMLLYRAFAGRKPG
jgi:hypothetical protein